MNFSLIITVKGRLEHLRNQLLGLKSSILIPSEIIIVAINEPDLDLSDFAELAIRIIHLGCDTERLPIAMARNTGAREATGDKLFFLDVDCIPDQSYFEMMMTYYKDDRVLMGDPYYLPKNPGKLKSLINKAIPHPHRPRVKEAYEATDYNLFWSLCFAVSKDSFDSIGGFDEGFLGYGGEDTDFAWKLKEADLKLWMVPAIVYHQQHPVYIPPLGHLESIVDNANYFYKKRGFWIMETWLKSFEEMGLIEWNQMKDFIHLVRHPSPEEQTAAYKEDALFM